MDANTEIETEQDQTIDDEEFCDRTLSLQILLQSACDDEPNPGVVIYALLNALAVNVHDSIEANGADRDQAIQEIQEDLDDLLKRLKDGKYFQDPKKFMN